MSFEELGDAIINIEYLLERRLKAIKENGPDAKVMLEISDDYRMLACGALLMDYNISSFVENLKKSGQNYLQLHSSKDKHKLDDYYLATGYAHPLLDAIAINSSELAKQIIKHLPEDCMYDQGEMEDDYCYYKLVAELVCPSSVQREELIEKVEPFAADSIKLQILVNLASSSPSQEAFNESFTGLVEQWYEESMKKQQSGKLGPYAGKTTAFVFIEGLALIRLAQLQGLKVEQEYKGIPGIAISDGMVSR